MSQYSPPRFARYVAFALLVVSCRLVGADSAFRGFKALAVPRETIPIGAEWINGVGPNGDGVGDDNVAITRSLREAAFDRHLKQQLDLSILSYFNINQKATTVSNISYNDIAIHTIKDVTKVQLTSGQAVLYEYLKAGKISIKLKGEISSDLKARFEERVKDLKIEASGGAASTLTISGENMILAYRVFQLGKPKTESASSKLKMNKNGPYPLPVKLLGYEVEIQTRHFAKAVQAVGGVVNPDFSMADWERCGKSAPIKVSITNIEKMNMAGEPFRNNFDIENGQVKTLQIRNRVAKGIATDLVTVAFGFEFPKLPLTFLYNFLDQSKVSVQRILTPLEMMPNPEAPGW